MLLLQIFPTLQEPLRHLRVNRTRFAAMAQSCLDMSGVASGALVLTPAGASSNNTSARSSTADDSAQTAEAAAKQLMAATEASAAAAAGAASERDG